MENTIKQKYFHRGSFFMRQIYAHNLSTAGKKTIEERSVELAHYIIESKDTVRGAAKKFGVSKSTVHTDISKVEILKIPSMIELARGTDWSPKAKVKIAVKI